MGLSRLTAEHFCGILATFLLGLIRRALSSFGRAPRLHRGGEEFEPPRVHKEDMRFKPQHKVRIGWSSDFAYAIGLLTSDGNLSKDKRHIKFGSKDVELMEKFKQALSLKNAITKNARGGETEKRYLSISFGDVVFYKFLNKIGLTAAKSKTIQSVKVPDKFFRDFFRGVFDGDGTFYTFWDKRWPNSFVFKTSIASASIVFIHWLKGRLTKLYKVKGFIHKVF